MELTCSIVVGIFWSCLWACAWFRAQPWRKILIAEKNNLVLQQSGANGLLQIGREGLGQVNPVQLSAQCACDLSNDHVFIVAQALG